MRVLFGVLSLLLVLAIVGSLAKNQLQALSGGERRAADAAAAAAGQSLPPPEAQRAGAATAPAVPRSNASGGSVAEQARSLQQKMRDDTERALQQGAERNEAAPR